MKLFEFYEKNHPNNSAEDFFRRQDEVEKVFNIEAWNAQQIQKEFYRKNQMVDSDSVPVFDKPPTEHIEDQWTNLPDDSEYTSSGYKGLQNVKRRAGHPKDEIDMTVPHSDPASEQVLPPDQQSLIDDALKRLGL